MRILLVEDDPILGDGIRTGLLQDQYNVDWITRGDQAAQALHTDSYDLLLLDLNLPVKSGLEILKELRHKDNAIPVLILTARDATEDRVRGLDMGADDYLPKPFSLAELRARIRAILRRHYLRKRKKIITGDITIDREKHEVTVGRETVSLTPVEFKILEALASREGFIFSRDMLLDHVWDGEKCVVDRTIDVHIRHLRAKLGNAGKTIKNVRSIGYKLEI